jgi:hypothetical protein
MEEKENKMPTVKKATKKTMAAVKKAGPGAGREKAAVSAAPAPAPAVPAAAGLRSTGSLPAWVIPTVLGVVAVVMMAEMIMLIKGKVSLQRDLKQTAAFGERGGVQRPEAWFGAINLKSDRNDRLFLVDSDWNKIVVYDAKAGQFLLALSGKDVGHDFTPGDVAGDDQGMIYALDRTHQQVFVFSPKGALVRQWPAPSAVGIAVNHRGEILISDNAKMQIVFYTPEGKELRRVGGPGNGRGQFSSPSRMETDKQDHIYVVDLGNKRMVVLSPDGKFKATWAFKFEPTVLLGCTIYKDEIYLNDFGGSRIWTYSLDGKLLGTADITCPSNLAADSQGSLYLPTVTGIGRYIQTAKGAK